MDIVNLKLLTDISCVKCSLCLDVFEKPCRISCGHVFCENCLLQFTKQTAPQCPNCRQFYDAHKYHRDTQTDNVLQSSCVICEGCAYQVPLTKYNIHMSACEKAVAVAQQRIRTTSIEKPKVTGPNRHTFQCPYCGLKNLELGSLQDHCVNKHARDARPVVCPICASMPWGDPTMTSSNFIRHLSVRHKFEYETFVDYAQDDDDMLRAAILASLEHN